MRTTLIVIQYSLFLSQVTKTVCDLLLTANNEAIVDLDNTVLIQGDVVDVDENVPIAINIVIANNSIVNSTTNTNNTNTTTTTSVNNITNTSHPWYKEPLWWPRFWALQGNVDLAEPLQRCRKRTSPPPVGTPCRFAKACYFGIQDCNGYGAHPETRCVCSAFTDTWLCIKEECPVYPPPSTGCIVAPLSSSMDNSDIENTNTVVDKVRMPTIPNCPSIGPLDKYALNGTCVPSLYGKSCGYGYQKWYVQN
jgi:hypothetical protein